MNLDAGAVLANITRFGQTAAKKASKIAENVSQSKVQQDYDVGACTATAGPQGMWKVHQARPRKATYGTHVLHLRRLATASGRCGMRPAVAITRGHLPVCCPHGPVSRGCGRQEPQPRRYDCTFVCRQGSWSAVSGVSLVLAQARTL
jgi:hypothetical protein